MLNAIQILPKNKQKILKKGFSSPGLSQDITLESCKNMIHILDKCIAQFKEAIDIGYNYEYFPLRIEYDKFKAKSKRLSNIKQNLFGPKTKPKKVFVYSKNLNDLKNTKQKRTTVEIYRIQSKAFLDSLNDIKKHIKLIIASLNGNTEIKINNLDKALEILDSVVKETNKTRVKNILAFISNVKDVYCKSEQIIKTNNHIRYIMLEDKPKNMFEKLNVENTFFVSKGLNLIDDSDLKKGTVENIKFKEFIFSEVVDIGKKFEEINENDLSTSKIFDIDDTKDTNANYPVVGVIDTEYIGSNNISSFVQVDNSYSGCKKDHFSHSHGTKISSLIVANDELNKDLIDNCGNIQVKHFSLCLHCVQSSKLNIKKIYQIIENNKHIKVWNLSLNIKKEVNSTIISFYGAVLDHIQRTLGVLIINGVGNVSRDQDKIAVMADSVMALTISGLNKLNQKSDSSRTSFDYFDSYLMKPDVSYYSEDIKTLNNEGEIVKVDGVSFASALIARKAAYLAKYVTTNTFLIKAFIINGAALNSHEANINFKELGFGICPLKISKITNSEDHQIKLYFDDKLSESKELYAIIPMTQEEKFNYIPLLTFVNDSDLDPTVGIDYIKYEIKPTLRFKDSVGKPKPFNNFSMPNTNSNKYDEELMKSKNFAKYKIAKHYQWNSNARAKTYKDPLNKELIIIIDKQFRTPDEKATEEIKFGAVLTLVHIDKINNYNIFKTILASKIDELNYIPLIIEDKINIQTELNQKINFEE